MELGDKPGIDIDKAREAVYGGLKWWASTKGYKPAFAAVKYLQIFGKYPDFDCEPSAPQQGLIWWLGKERAAYAARRRKERAINGNAQFPIGVHANGSGNGKPSGSSPLMTEADWEVRL